MPKTKEKKVIGTPFEPGKSGNPNGRPKSEAAALRSEMRDAFCLEIHPKFNEIVNRIYKLAVENGDAQFFRMILDYCLGRPPTDTTDVQVQAIEWTVEKTSLILDELENKGYPRQVGAEALFILSELQKKTT